MSRYYKRVECADGFTVSVQAGYSLYCEPRRDGCVYKEVELGFPSEREPLLMKYAETASKPTETVYGWVPVELVAVVIQKHGGMVAGELPEGIQRRLDALEKLQQARLASNADS